MKFRRCFDGHVIFPPHQHVTPILNVSDISATSHGSRSAIGRVEAETVSSGCSLMSDGGRDDSNAYHLLGSGATHSANRQISPSPSEERQRADRTDDYFRRHFGMGLNPTLAAILRQPETLMSSMRLHAPSFNLDSDTLLKYSTRSFVYKGRWTRR